MFKRLLPIILFAFAAHAQTIVPMFGGNAQHTAVYSPAAQHLNSIHWSASIDLNNTGAFAHYGAPLITPANTIVVPQKTGSTSISCEPQTSTDLNRFLESGSGPGTKVHKRKMYGGKT